MKYSNAYFCFLILCISYPSELFGSAEIYLSPGFARKIRCEGRLFLWALGNESIVALQALPKELGCGVVVKPLVKAGRTNLILETSTGSVERILEIQSNGKISHSEVLVKSEDS